MINPPRNRLLPTRLYIPLPVVFLAGKVSEPQESPWRSFAVFITQSLYPHALAEFKELTPAEVCSV